MGTLTKTRRESQEPDPIETAPGEPKETADSRRRGRASRDASLEARLQELAADYQRRLSTGIE